MGGSQNEAGSVCSGKWSPRCHHSVDPQRLRGGVGEALWGQHLNEVLHDWENVRGRKCKVKGYSRRQKLSKGTEAGK